MSLDTDRSAGHGQITDRLVRVDTRANGAWLTVMLDKPVRLPSYVELRGGWTGWAYRRPRGWWGHVGMMGASLANVVVHAANGGVWGWAAAVTWSGVAALYHVRWSRRMRRRMAEARIL